MYGTWHLLFGPEGLQYEKYFRNRPPAVWDATEINSKDLRVPELSPASR